MYEAGTLSSELNAISNSLSPSEGITVERVQAGPQYLNATGLHFQGFQKPDKYYLIFGLVNRQGISNWFNSMDK